MTINFNKPGKSMCYQKQFQTTYRGKIVFSFFSLLLLHVTAIAQSSKSSFQQPSSASPLVAATLKGTPYKFPATFKLSLPVKQDDDTSIILHREYESGIFLACPNAGFNRDETIEKIKGLALERLLPKESKQFAWKSVAEVVKLSKYDRKFGSLMGFNGQTRFIIEWHHIQFKKRDFLIGNFTVLGRGKEAEEGFKQGYGGMSLIAAEAAISLLNSITGEKVDMGKLGGTPTK
jgi:hypothetical protein